MKSVKNKIKDLETVVTYNISIKLDKQLRFLPSFYLIAGEILDKVKDEISKK
jgi:hypothetical protein